MNYTNSDLINDLDEAKQLVDVLQKRLMLVEQTLEDLTRSLEIASAVGQFHLTDGFKRASEQVLQDKMKLPEPKNQEDMKITIIE